LFLVLAAGIAQLRFRYVSILALGILSAINLFSASDYYRFAQTEDWSNVSRDVIGFVEKDDLILFQRHPGAQFRSTIIPNYMTRILSN